MDKRSLEAQVVAEEDKHASSQLWTHWRRLSPMFRESSKDELPVVHFEHSKRPDHDAVHTFDQKSASKTDDEKINNPPALR